LLLLFSLSPSDPHRVLHSFPTRRSSDLLDAARSSPLRCCLGCDRKIPSAMVAPSDESCPLAFAARARPHRLRFISGRRRLSHRRDRKSTRLNSSHVAISYAVFCLKKKKK